jgi:hypothetical protein
LHWLEWQKFLQSIKMKLSEYIKLLQNNLENHGDMPVYIGSHSLGYIPTTVVVLKASNSIPGNIKAGDFFMEVVRKVD